MTFYNSNTEYPGHIIFNYPYFIDENNDKKNALDEIILFNGSLTYTYEFSRMEISNNIFGVEVYGFKVIDFTNKDISRVKIESSLLNSEISINDEININDKLIFKPYKTALSPGEYIFEFAPIMIMPNEEKSDFIEYCGNYNQNNNYPPEKYISSSFKIKYIVKCYEKCKTCTQLGNDTFYYCEDCSDDFFYNVNNGEKCLDSCDNYIIQTEDKVKCAEDCEEGQYKYQKDDNYKYCLSSCFYDDKELYLDEVTSTCFNNCSDNSNGNKYIYENKCVSQCPKKYHLETNNTCIYGEIIIEEEEKEEEEKEEGKKEEEEEKVEEEGEEEKEEGKEEEEERDEKEEKKEEKEGEEKEEEKKEEEEEKVEEEEEGEEREEEKEREEIEEREELENNENNFSSYVELSDETDTNNSQNNLDTDQHYSSSESSISEDSDIYLLLIKNFIENNSLLEIQQLENNITLYCYSSKTETNSLIDLNSSLIYVNLGQCQDRLISENNLDSDSDLLIISWESYNLSKDSAINDFNYEIYTREGQKINDLSPCQDTEIEISSPINDLDKVNYDKALILSEQGYDIFNISSNFYYDVCTSAYLDNNDLTLSVRQQEIFPNNISLCVSGCNYKSVDLEIKRFYCSCMSKNFENEKDYFIEEVEQNFFIYLIDMINYQIVVCYKNLFNKNNYFYNFGFYVGCFLLTLIFILLFVYIFIGRTSLRLEILHKQPRKKEIIYPIRDINRRRTASFKTNYSRKSRETNQNLNISGIKIKKRKISFKSKTNKFQRIKIKKSINSNPPLRSKSKKKQKQKKFSKKEKKKQIVFKQNKFYKI